MKRSSEIIFAITFGIVVGVFSNGQRDILMGIGDNGYFEIITSKEKDSEELIREGIGKYLREYDNEKIVELKIENNGDVKKIKIILDCRVLNYQRWGLDSAFIMGKDIMYLVKVVDSEIKDIDISFYETRYGGHEEIGLRCINRELYELSNISYEDYLNPDCDLTTEFEEIRTDGDYWRTGRGELFDTYDFTSLTEVENRAYNEKAFKNESFYKILKYYFRAIDDGNRERLIELTYQGGLEEVQKEIFEKDDMEKLKIGTKKFYEKREFVFTKFIDGSVWIYGSNTMDCPSVVLQKNSNGQWRVKYETLEVHENLEIP